LHFNDDRLRWSRITEAHMWMDNSGSTDSLRLSKRELLYLACGCQANGEVRVEQRKACRPEGSETGGAYI